MILSLLKERTRDLHERVERSVDLLQHLHSSESYRSLLSRFLGYYEPFESRLAAMPNLDLAGRLKAGLLRDDLKSLGLSGGDVAGLPRCGDLPPVNDMADALGCMYVLEGATLGGQIVRRQAEARLGVAPGRGCSFFSSYGERVGPMWKEFGRAVETYAAAHPGAEGRILAAAAATFTTFERWVAGGAA